MKVITQMELKPGMVLGEDVEYQGAIVYPTDTELDDHIISRIRRYGIMCVTIKEDVDFATTHYEKIQFNSDFQDFIKIYKDCLSRYKGIMISYLGTKQPVPSEDLLSLFRTAFTAVRSESQLLDFLYNMMPNEDELTYTQSFNAALLCGAFANWLSLPPEQKNTLILCGFYYDIGKWKLPNEILWKPGKLTDEEFSMVKKHPVIGYMLLRGDVGLNEHIKNCTIMHHERMDGSGYPYHMKGEKIDIYARYLAIVDTYIAMASPRSFRPAFTPLEILENFENNRGKYDVSILMPLFEHISNAQIGTKVQLSDGSEWEVMLIHRHPFSRPMLRNNWGELLNLAEHPELRIRKLL